MPRPIRLTGGAVIVSEPAAGPSSALRFHVPAQSFPVGDVVRTGVLLESWSVCEVARHGERRLLRSVERLIDAMDDPELSSLVFHRLDAEFHLTLAQAGGNEVVAAVMAALRDSIAGYVLAAVLLLDLVGDRPDSPTGRARVLARFSVDAAGQA